MAQILKLELAHRTSTATSLQKDLASHLHTLLSATYTHL